MHLGRPARSKAFLWIASAIVLWALIFIVAFWGEIRWVFYAVPDISDLLNHKIPDPLALVVYIVGVGLILVFFIWSVLLSFQALLPITDILENFSHSMLDVYRTTWHFVLYFFHLHGPAIRVRDGKPNTTPEDEKRESLPGIVVVDYNSAVVLEERNPPPGLMRLFIQIIMGLLEFMRLSDVYESPRVRGAGLVFTRPRERIRGVVDLRPQFRMQSKVPCYTREGIELQANILSVFTINQVPDILQVAFIGPRRAENLRVLTFRPVPDQNNRLRRGSSINPQSNQLRLVSITNNLDEADRAEIFRFARSSHYIDWLHAYTDLPDTTRPDFNPERVFSAVYGQANDNKHEPVLWTDLPARVGADFYREILAQVNFDELYDINGSGQLPMNQYKASLRQRMLNSAILAYRLVSSTSELPMIVDQIYERNDLRVSEVQTLTNSKILRDRGIKILFCSFGDPSPVNEAVYQQRLDYWRAAWERDLTLTQASRDLEAMRVRARAYANAQRDLWLHLSQIFEQNEYTEEALALRVLQAIEHAADDPQTRALLPANTLEALRDVRMLLMPSDYLISVGKPPSAK